MKDYAINERTLGHILEDKAKTNKDKVFVQFRDEKKVTYAEINEIANRFGNSFSELGVKKDDKVCIFLPNCLEYIYAWFGLAKIGAVEVPINTAYKGYLLGYIINQSDANVLVVDKGYLERVKPIQDSLEKIKNVIVYSGEEPFEENMIDGLKIPAVPFSKLFEGSIENPQVGIKHSDLIAFIYTSGTTGPSKGCMLSHCAYYAFGENYAKAMQMRSDDIFYECLPAFHANFQCLATMPVLLTDSTLVIDDWFHASTFWEQVRKNKVTIFNFIGSILPVLLSRPPEESDKAHVATRTFGVPAPDSIREAFRKRFGDIKIVEGMGNTEGSVFIYELMDEPRRPGSCGKSAEVYEVKIFDEDDNELPPGVVGEFVCRPKGPFSIFSGYYKMPEKTVEALRNCWYHTGDGGYMDKDGYFYFQDRIKDSIRRRGENISSYEVEKVLCEHPAIKECSVIAVKDEGMTEDEVKACIIPKEDVQLGYEELIEWCADRMTSFMIPRYIEFMDDFPRTPTAKIEKYKMRQDGITANTWDREKAGIKIKRDR